MNQHLPAFIFLRKKVSVIVAPFRYIVDAPVSLVRRLGANFINQQHLLEINAELQAKELLLRARLQALTALYQEQNHIKQLIKNDWITHWFSEKFLIAHLLAADINPFVEQLLVDKGRRDHIYEGQPVIDGYGLLGQIMSVGELTSRILLVTDRRGAVPVQIQRTGFRAIAVGQGASGLLKLVHIPDTTDIKVGDKIVTSGLGGRYPAGYPVGQVQHVRHNMGQTFATVLLSPSAHLHQGRQVLLVWPKPVKEK